MVVSGSRHPHGATYLGEHFIRILVITQQHSDIRIVPTSFSHQLAKLAVHRLHGGWNWWPVLVVTECLQKTPLEGVKFDRDLLSNYAEWAEEKNSEFREYQYLVTRLSLSG
jgi:hypothetical protein